MEGMYRHSWKTCLLNLGKKHMLVGINKELEKRKKCMGRKGTYGYGSVHRNRLWCLSRVLYQWQYICTRLRENFLSTLHGAGFSAATTTCCWPDFCYWLWGFLSSCDWNNVSRGLSHVLDAFLIYDTLTLVDICG